MDFTDITELPNGAVKIAMSFHLLPLQPDNDFQISLRALVCAKLAARVEIYYCHELKEVYLIAVDLCEALKMSDALKHAVRHIASHGLVPTTTPVNETSSVNSLAHTIRKTYPDAIAATSIELQVGDIICNHPDVPLTIVSREILDRPQLKDELCHFYLVGSTTRTLHRQKS